MALVIVFDILHSKICSDNRFFPSFFILQVALFNINHCLAFMTLVIVFDILRYIGEAKVAPTVSLVGIWPKKWIQNTPEVFKS